MEAAVIMCYMVRKLSKLIETGGRVLGFMSLGLRVQGLGFWVCLEVLDLVFL